MSVTVHFMPEQFEQSSSPTLWHTLEIEKVYAALDATDLGLTAIEHERRLKLYGANRLSTRKGPSKVLRFLEQFNNLLIYLLIVAGLITLALGHLVDSAVIFLVVVINALIGYIQEGKAEKALEAIRQMLANMAMVRRDGRLSGVPAESLVPGDVITLQSGDRVPADVRLFKSRELRIDESILTGESMPVEKDLSLSKANASLGDRLCIAYSGTFVTYGQAMGIVIATGDRTELGRISGLLGDIQTLTTPLLRQIAEFARWLSLTITVIAALTFVFGVLVHQYSMTDMFMAAVGLAVAAIPEGLPAIMTITLAIGVQRMAQRNAIIRRLPAVETLGAVTTICSDKTGTLTRNEMTAQSVTVGSGVFEISGVGYDPHGGFSLDDKPVNVDDYPALREITHAAMLCNDAVLEKAQNGWRIHGDPTEGALLTLAMKAGLDLQHERELWPRTDAIPFESQHRFMATLHHDHAGHAFIFLKGAPEQVMAMCHHQRVRGEDEPLDRAYWEAGMERMAIRGQRLLAIAFRPVEPNQRELRFSDVQDGLSLLGIIGLIDPPRTEAITAIDSCQSAGINVKMITGDHAVTARAIARQMGLNDTNVIKGGDIDRFDDQQLNLAVQVSDVFARTSPEHKLRIVTALQATGQVVAMTGDGVNDAPALKRADVGIAMGKKGTEVAKEASEMVLADDNFASITNAVEEGRTVYDNLKKSILFILPTNGGEAMTIIAAIALGRMMPITPVQILWVNMITAVTLALALAFEPAEESVMNRPPRNPDEPLLSRFLIWRIVFVSLILVSGTFGIFLWEREHGADIEWARTIAVNTLVMFEIFYLLSSRYILAPALTLEGLKGNRYIWFAIGLLLLFQMAFTYLPALQYLFGTVALDMESWIRLTLISSSVLLLVELEKAALRWYKGKLGMAAEEKEP